jgi:hypothetical protein
MQTLGGLMLIQALIKAKVCVDGGKELQQFRTEPAAQWI